MTILLKKNHKSRRINHIVSWDKNFSDYFTSKLNEFFYKDNDLICPLYNIHPDINIIEIRGNVNYYKSNSYNPIYIVYYNYIPIVYIHACVYRSSTLYTTKIHAKNIKYVQKHKLTCKYKKDVLINILSFVDSSQDF